MTDKKKKKAAVAAANAVAEAGVRADAGDIQSERSSAAGDRFWFIGCIVVTAVATVLRFFWIALKPLHHDEGVNGHFLTPLFREGLREGVYKYDPTNYHGPTLYFISLAFTKIFGLNTAAVRWSVAIFGVGIVLLVFCLRRYIGTVGAITAGAFLALSPGLVFISRYFIHEISFVFFTLGIVIGVLYFMEKPAVGPIANAIMAFLLLICFIPMPLFLPSLLGEFEGATGTAIMAFFFLLEAAIVFGVIYLLGKWRDGKPIYLLLAVACVALLFATKETAFISLGTMLIAIFCVWIYRKLFVDETQLGETWQEPIELTVGNFLRHFGKNADAFLLLTICAAVFTYVSVLFFSSFFTYPEGIGKAFEAYAVWTKTGTKDHAENGFFAYFKWLGLLEAPIAILAAVGSLVAFAKARHRFAMFTALWAFGLLAAYTLIPYKTPWLAISFVMPMCVIAGYGINELVGSAQAWQRITGMTLAFVAVMTLTVQTVELNFFQYDNEKRSYVYAHTSRDFEKLTNKIYEIADTSGKKKELEIAIVSPEYWPMPWYLNDYSKAAFHGRPVPANMADVIVTSRGQEDDCKRGEKIDAGECRQLNEYKRNYTFVEGQVLRPGVELRLYERNDLLGKPLNQNPIEVPDAGVEYGNENSDSGSSSSKEK
jgi:uncharacterized protein (TIGR03663 family)